SSRAPKRRSRTSCSTPPGKSDCERSSTRHRKERSSTKCSSRARPSNVIRVPHASPAMQPVTAYIALGSNLGDRHANLAAAIERLRATTGITVTKISTPLENPAVGGPADSPPFVNAVAEVQTSLSPHDLLDRLLAIEQELGRVRRERWGPRVIDLDVV